MRVAILSDIHGNLLALDAVLADLAGQGGADRLVIAGDLCLDGPQPRETLERLRNLECTIIQGNTDRDLALSAADTAESDEADLLEWTRQQLTAADLEFLRALPFTEIIEAPKAGNQLQVVHANPLNLDQHLPPNAPADEIAPLLATVASTVTTLAFGHLHLPYVREFDRLLLVDIASVGLPKDGDRRANYAIFEWTDAGWSIDQHRVEYPVDQVVAQLRAANPPDVDRLIRNLLRARYPNMAQARGGREPVRKSRQVIPAAPPEVVKRPGGARPQATAAPLTPPAAPAPVPDPGVAITAQPPSVAPQVEAMPAVIPPQHHLAQPEPMMMATGSFPELLPAILTERLAAVLVERETVLADIDPGGVHDMRVATRRLRAALIAAEPFYERKRYRRTARRVKAFGQALGAVRELDVLLIDLRKRLSKAKQAEQAGLQSLIAEAVANRAIAYTALLEVLPFWEPTSRYVTDFARFARRPRLAGRKSKIRDLMVHVAARALSRDLAAFEPQTAVFAQAVAEPELFHELRIAGKKMRYTLELFQPVMGESAGDLVSALKKLQELLGEMHDRDVLIDLVTAERARAQQREQEALAAAASSDQPAPERRAAVQAILAGPESFDATATGLYGLLIDASEERQKLEQQTRALWAKLQKQEFVPQLYQVIHFLHEQEGALQQGAQPMATERP